MSTWLLSDLLELDPAVCGTNPQISGLATDSRLVEPGFLFLACRGTESHGLNFIDQAIARGAVAVAWEPGAMQLRCGCALPHVAVPNLSRRVGPIAARYYGDPSRKLFAMGVTGTDGKTSCAHLFAQTAKHLGRRCGLIGTIGFGYLDDLEPATHTTPDPVALQSWLARLVDTGADSLAMEVSSHALDQGRINGVALDVAVYTNLSRDHLDYHGDLRNYAKAKRRLLESPALSALILNIDDDYGMQWAVELADSRPVVSYSIDTDPVTPNWVRATDLLKSPEGLQFNICTPNGTWPLKSGLLGHFNIYNLLAVAAAWQAAGVPMADVVAALQLARTVPGRIEAFRAAQRPLVVVDYAHTSGAISQILRAVSEHRATATDSRIICVFGCGGDRDPGKRPQMAAAAAAMADVLVMTDDNPRSESPQAIIADMQAGLPAGYQATVIHDRATAIAHAIALATPNDVVLIAGKGHEEYQQIGTERRPFSDRVQVARALGQEGLACSA